jgi:hypothetical protein
MDNLGVLLPVVAGVTVGLSGALFGTACSRHFRPGTPPRWTRPLLIVSAAFGILGSVTGVAAMVWGPPVASLAAVVGGTTIAVLSALFAGRPAAAV